MSGEAKSRQPTGEVEKVKRCVVEPVYLLHADLRSGPGRSPAPKSLSGLCSLYYLVSSKLCVLLQVLIFSVSFCWPIGSDRGHSQTTLTLHPTLSTRR